MEFFKKYIHTTYKALAIFGAAIVGIYILFRLIALQFPFFENRWIFQFFDVGLEANMPTYFSVLIFLIMGIVAWIIGGIEKSQGNRAWPWIGTTILLLFLGLDELGEVHEQLTWHTQQLLDVSGFLAFAWVIPYLIIVALLSIFYIPFLWKLKYRAWFFWGAIVFITGAAGVEMIGAYFYDTQGVMSAGFIIASSIEEIMEIAGLLIALGGFIREMNHRLPYITKK